LFGLARITPGTPRPSERASSAASEAPPYPSHTPACANSPLAARARYSRRRRNLAPGCLHLFFRLAGGCASSPLDDVPEQFANVRRVDAEPRAGLLKGEKLAGVELDDRKMTRQHLFGGCP